MGQGSPPPVKLPTASLPCRNDLAGQHDPWPRSCPSWHISSLSSCHLPLPRGQVGLKAIPSCASHLANGVGRNPDGQGFAP